MLKNLTVLKKLLLVMICALTGMVVLGGYALFSLKASMMEERKIKTRHVVESAYGVLEHYHALQKAGKLNEGEAQQAVQETIKTLRYEGKEYFWINDLGTPIPKMIMHPTVPSLDGKILDATKFNCATLLQEGIDGQVVSTDGKLNLFVAFNTVVNKAAHGYVTYMWPKPKQGGGTTEETYPKLSYVKKFEPWGWVIGSGIYIDDINAAFRESALKFGAIIAALSLVMGLFIYRIARAITVPLAHGVKAAQGIAEGDIEVDIPVESGDEIGQLMLSLRAMQAKLRHIVEDIRAIVGAAVDGDFSKRIEVGGHKGFAHELAENLNRLNEITHVGLSDVMRVANACAVGDLSQQITRQYPGAFGQTSAGINAIVAALNEIVAEIHAIVEASGKGDFGERMELAGKQGYTRSLSEQINQLCDITEGGLKDIMRVAKALAAGDLTQSIAKEYPGLFGEARNGVNATVEHLRQLVTEIKEAVDAIHSAAGEIASGNLDLSKRTEDQAQSLDRTAENVAQLTKNVKLNAEHAVQANQLSRSASEIVVRGGTVVRESVTTMEAINQSSQKIAEIIGVIDGIAFQTNILALNAAVEAARAGEQGRGFAVVASEVRALAQRSAGAAREIKELISASVANVASGTAQVNEAGSQMDHIVTSIERVTQIVQEISSASAEQSAGIEQVNQAVAQMDNVTQQNAALVEQAAAAAAALEDQASQLAAAVAAFRLESGQALPAPKS